MPIKYIDTNIGKIPCYISDSEAYKTGATYTFTITGITQDKLNSLSIELGQYLDADPNFRLKVSENYYFKFSKTSNNVYRAYLNNTANPSIVFGTGYVVVLLFDSSLTCCVLQAIPDINSSYQIVYYPDFVSSIMFTDLQMVNFYRSSPEGDINVNRGETVNLEFTAVYEDGSSGLYTDVVYSDLPPESTAVFDGNSFTIAENCRASIFTSIAKPNIGETTLYAFVQAKILNPVNPYLPDGGGISGGGVQSGSSNVIGSFDGTPGPSIIDGIPDGAVGSDIASSGMYTKYLCDTGLLNVISQYLWEDNVGIQALKAIIGNPIDSIISLISYPFALDSLVPVTSTKIYFGKYNSLLSASAITKSSLQIDWGTVEIPFFWGGFLDYSPYTQIQLYLPWGAGFVSLDPNEVMPWSSENSYTQGSFTKGSVSVVTNIELDKGSCVHNVIGNNGRVIGSFGGICGKQVPVVGTNDAARTLALIGAAVSAGTTLGMVATGQPSAGMALAYGKNMSQMQRAEGREMLSDYNSAVSGMLASSKAAAKSPTTFPRAGTFSDGTSLLTVQYPYLIISRPSQSIPEQYGRFMGYPSNIFHNHLGEVKGYTEVSNIHLDNIPATSTELDELESILKGGVFL